MTRLNFKAAIIGAAFALTSLAGAAQAATVSLLPENFTTVEVTAPIGDLGLGGAPTGTATVAVNGMGNPVFSFPITGGALDTDAGTAQIEHDGSGVSLFALADDTISATVGNFVVDTELLAVFGNVNGGSDSVRLFDLDTAAIGGIGLNISDDLAGALTAVFGAPDLSTVQFGLANTNPVPAPSAVPLPAGAPLLIAGLAALGLMRRRATFAKA